MSELADLMLAGSHVLREGECYFDLLFDQRDDDGKFPCVETYIYVGTDKSECCFQTVESYLKYGNLLKRPSSRWPKKNTGFVVTAPDYVAGMFDIHGLAAARARLGDERR